MTDVMHTPTPWAVKKFSAPMTITGPAHQIVSVDDFPAAFVPAWHNAGEDGGDDAAEARANAELIVRAVNSYEEMRAALEKLMVLEVSYSVGDSAGRAPWAAFAAGIAKALTEVGKIARAALDGAQS